jgi:hypothetical protein
LRSYSLLFGRLSGGSRCPTGSTAQWTGRRFSLHDELMDLTFAWDDWNLAHIARHGVGPREAEYVVHHASPPWPEEKGDDKLLVWGATAAGDMLQVIFVFKRPDELEFDALDIEHWAEVQDHDQIIYVVHAMPLTVTMKKRFRRRSR